MGCVPEIEEREAAVYAGYRFSQWQRIDHRERAAIVAHYRSHLLIEQHIQQAANRAAEIKANSKAR